MIKIKNKIPKFKSVEEEAVFWDTHSIADYLGELKRIDNPFVDKTEAENALTVRFTPYVKKALEVRAQDYDLTPTALIRLWVVDKLIESKSRKNLRVRTA